MKTWWKFVVKTRLGLKARCEAEEEPPVLPRDSNQRNLIAISGATEESEGSRE